MGGRGSGGHTKKSQSLKKLHGTYRKDRDQGKGGGILDRMRENRGIPGKSPPESPRGPANPRAPQSLGKAGQKLWRHLVGEYDFTGNPGDLLLLELLCSIKDEMVAAREMVERDGSLLTDPRTGRQYPHPGIAIEARARSSFLATFKSLGLE